MSSENEKINKAELQIRQLQQNIKYDTKDLRIFKIVNNFKRNNFYLLGYLKSAEWEARRKVAFIESVLLGLPTPLIFLNDCGDGKYEIIDGYQRIESLVAFALDKMQLTELEKLTELEGFYFSDLRESRREKFLNISLRIIVLDKDTPPCVKQDLFYRFNTHV